MKYEIACTICGHSSESMLDYKCPSCGKPLNMKLTVKFDREKIRKQEQSLWRYAEFFPYLKDEEIITLGEGWTPLVRYSDNLFFKLESLNPTGSFKDRGSAPLISALQSIIRKAGGYIAEDSSGNAGASMAAYAARAGLKIRVYVPDNVSGSKLNQTLFYGAEVVRVSGGRGRVAEEAQKPEPDKFYVGHILHPLFRDGIRSLAYEILEQSNGQLPGTIYIPVSAGTLLLGLISGLDHLVQSGVVDHMPRVVACQTRQVSPLYHRLRNLKYTPPSEVTSVADALVSINPPLLDLMTEKLKEIGGDAVIVEEEEILSAFRELARKGFYVEPSSAVAYAAFKKRESAEKASDDGRTVIVLTGAGLKTTLKPDF